MAAIIRKISQFSKREIDSLWKKARRVVRHDGLDLLKAPRSSDMGRILMIIPKRIGSAPVRNRLRRQIRHLFYEQELYDGDFDWIAIARPGAETLPYSKLLELFLQAASK